MAPTLMAHSPGLARTIIIVPTGHFMQIHPWLELFFLVPSIFEPLKFYCTGNPKMGRLANSEDPDEMQDNAAFHRVFTVC